MKKSLLACLAIATLLGAGTQARASSKSDRIERARQQIRSSQESQLIALLRAADTKRAEIEESLASISARMGEINRTLAVMRPKVAAARAALQAATDDAHLAQASFDLSRRQLASNALNLYATAQWDDALAFLNAEDLASVASAEVYMNSVLRTNTRMINTYRTTAATLADRRARVARRTATLEAQARPLEDEMRALQRAVAEKQRAADDLSTALTSRARALAGITGAANGFAVILRSYGDSTKQIHALVAAGQIGEPVEVAKNGALWTPVSGPITSPFGWRIHPILHVRSFHTGIDIGSPYGNEITAARAGTVLDVVYLGAYGLVTIIDNGFSVATMYAHQSRVFVKPGQGVQAGQPIGAVGCTGWCTGPHLHFEVWSRGEPQNPQFWI